MEEIKICEDKLVASDVTSTVEPSVESDNKNDNSNLRGKEWSNLRESLQRRKRPRRKSRRGKPYTRTTWQQKRGNRSERALQIREEMFANGQPVAPYNTTQFLMEDHGEFECELPENKDNLPNVPNLANKPPRARDSSFSIDSDDDYFYCSPEDEEEFLVKEFSNAYEDLHVERLSSMSKSEIIYDFLQLESKYEKCLSEMKKLKRNEGNAADESGKKEEGGGDTDTSSKSEPEIMEKLRIAQLENKTILLENEELRRENKKLLSLLESKRSSSASSSSVDSDSDSSSSSSSFSSSSSNSKHSVSSDTPNNDTKQETINSQCSSPARIESEKAEDSIANSPVETHVDVEVSSEVKTDSEEALKIVSE